MSLFNNNERSEGSLAAITRKKETFPFLDEEEKKTLPTGPWTVSFLSLANRFTYRVPSSDEKSILQNAGTGFKKIKLYLSDGEKEVLKKITNSELHGYGDNNIKKGLQQLKQCGGFELLRCLANSRDLLPCSFTAKK